MSPPEITLPLLHKLRDYFRDTIKELNEELNDESPNSKSIQELDNRVCSEIHELVRLYGEYDCGDDAQYLDNLKDIRELQKLHAKTVKAARGVVKRINDTLEEQRAQKEKLSRDGADLKMGGVSSSNQKQGGLPQFLKMPQLELPKFDGNITEFASWKETFSANVDQWEIPSVTKFTFLKSVLRGVAFNKIASLPVTSESYLEAFKILNENFGRSRTVIYKLVHKLVSLNNVKEEPRDLHRFHDEVLAIQRALKENSVDIEEPHARKLVIPLLESRVSGQLRSEWERMTCLSQKEEEITVERFLSHVLIAARVAESQVSCKLNRPQVVERKMVNQGVIRPVKCPNCCGNHCLPNCSDFKSKDYNDRQQQARALGVCFICLNTGHQMMKCTSEQSCQKCKGRHHTLLHRPLAYTNVERNFNSSESSANVGHLSVYKTTLLMTARIGVIHNHRVEYVRALLDPGSQASFVTSRLVKALNLRGTQCQLSFSGVASMSTPASTYYQHIIALETRSGVLVSMDAIEVNRISDYAVPVPKSIAQYSHLKGLELADFGCESGKVEVLIGANMLDRYLTPIPDRIGKIKEPVAKHTKFGWVIFGNVNLENKSNNIVSVSHAVMKAENSDISQFWRLEETGISKEEFHSMGEKHAVRIFNKGVRALKNGHVEAPLPIKDNFENMLSSKHLALKRFNRLESRFRMNDAFKESYQQTMQSNFDLGFVEIIPDSEIALKDRRDICYVSHHAVFKETSSTTKLRIVFDASMKVGHGKSLNDQLYVGPKLQLNLIDILYRWSFQPIAIVADIAKMYQQVFIPQGQRDLLRFFWRPCPKGPIKECRHTRQVFGTASAAHSCVAAVQWNAKKFSAVFSEAVDIINTDMYVDDLVTGTNSEQKARQFVDQLIEINSVGGFSLRKWCSNCPKVISHLPDSLLSGENKSFLLSSTKALGYLWNPKEDYISLMISEDRSSLNKITKRVVLSDSSRYFDPQGRFAPIFFVGKLIYQDTWSRQLSWDEKLPEDLEKKWLAWKRDLVHLKDVQLPRCVLQPNYVYKYAELCVFGDASLKGVGAVMYLRIILDNDDIVTSFLVARTKVKPLKDITIPRMELEAALLCSKMVEHFLPITPIKISGICAFTDSSIVYHWICSDVKKWKLYVSNRVEKVQKIIAPSCWRWIPGVQNPADIASRGLSVKKFVGNELWMNGPPWLRVDKRSWPKDVTMTPEDQEHIGREMKSFVGEVLIIDSISPLTKMLNRFSKLASIQRCVAWLKRFCQAFKARYFKYGGPLSIKELHDSLICVARNEQKVHLPDHFHKLSNGGSIAIKDKLSNLGLVWDDGDGIIRVGGRLNYIEHIHPSMRRPILIPSDSRLAVLLIEAEHQRLLHSGPATTLASLRSRFWIIRGRQMVNSVFKKCIKCQLSLSQPIAQKMGDLPSSRVDIGPPFSHTGIDYAGPVNVFSSRRSRVAQKAYICLFTDLSTRAIHLELAKSLSTQDFLGAFRRFVCRRGIPSVIWSDHGRNFVGSANILAKFLQKEKGIFLEWSSKQGIQWKFIPPRAPNQGGAWESMIKLTKNILLRQFRNVKFSEEQLGTALIEVEAVINSRPLIPLSPEVSEQVLTPSMLLTGFNVTSLPDPFVECHYAPASRWRKLNHILKYVRKRWMSEYVLDLQRRQKWRHSIKEDCRKDKTSSPSF